MFYTSIYGDENICIAFSLSTVNTWTTEDALEAPLRVQYVCRVRTCSSRSLCRLNEDECFLISVAHSSVKSCFPIL